MASITLSSPLFDLLPEQERSRSRRRSVSLAARSWPEAAQEMRTRFPQLAQHVLTETDTVLDGFALVVNAEIVPNEEPPLDLDADDEICLIAQMAGG